MVVRASGSKLEAAMWVSGMREPGGRSRAEEGHTPCSHAGVVLIGPSMSEDRRACNLVANDMLATATLTPPLRSC